MFDFIKNSVHKQEMGFEKHNKDRTMLARVRRFVKALKSEMNLSVIFHQNDEVRDKNIC